MKICSKCKDRQKLDAFCKDSSKKDGHSTRCKKCRAEWDKKYRQTEKSKTYTAEYKKENKDKILESQKAYREKNRVKISNSQKNYRANNKKKIKKYRDSYCESGQRQKIIHKNKKEFFTWLSTMQCIDCGNKDYRVLEFDHRDASTKKYEISRKIGSVKLKNLMEEINKCDIRCSNCHKIRTAKQFNWYSYMD